MSESLDTNILIYSHEDNLPDKQMIASGLLYRNLTISSQVVSEYINVLRRKLPRPKHEVAEIAATILSLLKIHPVSAATIRAASPLILRYQLQLFDAIIVASMLEANCTILYSEDMKHGLLIDGKLRIINPFL